jgi:parvulin-like peptidyl-prolyl isomerase
MAALERMMVTKLREQQLEPVLSAVEVTDGEIEQYYDRHRDQYTSLAMFRGAMIRFAASDAMAKKKRDLILAKANSVLSLAKTLAPSVRGFGALAVEHSAHQPSRYRGGDIGWFSSGKAGSVPAEVTNALLGLQHEGELAPLVTAEDGYYLVKLLEKRPARTHALATQSQKIWQTLLHRKREQAEKDWLASLQPAGQVDVNHSLLASLAPSGIAHTENQHAGPPGLPLPYRFMPNGG